MQISQECTWQTHTHMAQIPR